MDILGNKPEDVSRVKEALQVNSIQLIVQIAEVARRNNLTYEESYRYAIRWLDAMLDACRREKVAAIITYFSFSQELDRKYDLASPRFWSNDRDKGIFLEDVVRLVRHFRQRRSELAAYDIISEPVVVDGGRGVAPPDWHAYQKRIIETVRKHDPHRWLVVKPGPWALPSTYQGFEPLALPKIVYGVHMYGPHAFTHQGIREWPLGPEYPGRLEGGTFDKEYLRRELLPLTEFKNKHGVLVWVGEFSALRWAKGAEVYLLDLVNIFNEQRFGWCYFSFGLWNGWNPDYNDVYPQAGDDLHSAKFRVGYASPRWKTLRAMFPPQRNED